MLATETDELRNQLMELKQNVDRMHEINRQTMQMIYNIEDRMIDQDDLDYQYKYGFLAGVR